MSNIHSQQFQLEIESENVIENKIIDSLGYKKKHSDFKSTREEVFRFKEKLTNSGYLNAEVKSLQKVSDSLFLAKVFVGDKANEVIVFYNNNDFTKNQLVLVSKKVTDSSFVLPFKEVEIALEKLISLKSGKGYSFSKLKLDSIKRDKSGELTAKLKLFVSEKRKIDSVVIKGYEKFSKSFLKYYLGVKTGDVFNKRDLLRKNERLLSIPFAYSIKPPEVLFTDKKTVVYFYLKKAQSNLFDGIIGFATNDKTSKLQFNGYLDLRLQNNLHFGEAFVLRYKADGNEQQNFLASISMPYLFKSPVGVAMKLNIFKRDSSFVTAQQRIAATYQFNQKINGTLGYEMASSTNLLGSVNGLEIEDYSSSNVFFGIDYKKNQNSVFFPRKIRIQISAGFGKRKKRNEPFSDNQVLFKSIASYIFNLDKKNSIFVKNQTSFLSSDSYVVNELFRFGGIENMRGFIENSIDASFNSVVNVEYRYVLNNQLFVHSVLDLGYYENQIIRLKQKLYSFGFGLGLRTQSSFFRLVVANGNLENQNIKFSNTKFHIQFTQPF